MTPDEHNRWLISVTLQVVTLGALIVLCTMGATLVSYAQTQWADAGRQNTALHSISEQIETRRALDAVVQACKRP